MIYQIWDNWDTFLVEYPNKKAMYNDPAMQNDDDEQLEIVGQIDLKITGATYRAKKNNALRKIRFVFEHCAMSIIIDPKLEKRFFSWIENTKKRYGLKRIATANNWN